MTQYPDYEEIIRYGEEAPRPGGRRDISCGAPVFLGNEREYVLDCIDRAWVTQGRYVSKAEQLLAELCGARYAIACSSGTAALHLGLLGLELNPGDAVIVPALTYVATANAVRYAGGTPIFCDVYRDTWCIDVWKASAIAQREAVSGRGIAGVIPVHLYGMVADLESLSSAPGLEEAWILEDAAEAIGAHVHGPNPDIDSVTSVGNLGDVGAFSFYGNKILTAGEGGAVVTDSERIAELASLYRGQGAPRPGCYDHDVVGFNYRMTDLQAAVLCGQLETFELHWERRIRVMVQYRELLEPFEFDLIELQNRDIPELMLAPAPWMMVVLLPTWRDGVTRDEVAAELATRGVQTRPAFKVIPDLPPYLEGGNEHHYPNALEISTRGLCLPTHAGLHEDQISYVVEQLLEVLR